MNVELDNSHSENPIPDRSVDNSQYSPISQSPKRLTISSAVLIAVVYLAISWIVQVPFLLRFILPAIAVIGRAAYPIPLVQSIISIVVWSVLITQVFCYFVLGSVLSWVQIFILTLIMVSITVGIYKSALSDYD